MKSLILAFLGLLFAPLQAESLPVADLNRNQPVSFASEIFPVLKANCLACHNSTKAKASLILESPEEMLKGGDSGPALVPGKADESLMFTTAAHIDDPVMPPPDNKSNAANFSPIELALLRQWINEGAKGSRVASAAPDSWTFLQGTQPIHTSALTADGRFAAVGRGQQIDIYDLPSGRQVASLVDASLPFAAAHLDLVQSLAFSSDGTLASGGFRTAKIWRREVPQASGEAIELNAEIVSSTLFPDGKGVGFGLVDGTIALFDHDKSEVRPVLIKDHSGAVRDMLISPDIAWVYSISADKSLRGRSLLEINNVKSAALPTPGTALALLEGGKHLLAATEDFQLHVYEAAGDFSKPVQSFKLLDSPVVGIRTYGGETAIAFRNGTFIFCRFDPAAVEKPPVETRRFAHGAELTLADFGEKSIVTAGKTGPAKLWKVEDGKLITEIKGDPTLPVRQGDITRLGTVNGRIKNYWTSQAPESEKLWKEESEKAQKSGEAIAKAKLDLAARTEELEKMESNPAAKPEEWEKAREALKKAQIDLTSATRNREDSSRLAGEALTRHSLALSHSLEAETTVAELKTLGETLVKKIAEIDGKFSVALLRFSGDGSTFVVGGADGVLRWYDGESGVWLENLTASGTTAIFPAPSGRWYASVQKKSQLLPWSGGGKWVLGKTLGNGRDAEPFSDRVSALAFSPDGRHLIAGGGVPSQSGEIVLFNTTDGSMIKKNPKAHGDTITSFSFSPDGRQFVSGASDRLVRTFQIDSLEKIETFEGHTSHVLDVDWNADGLTLVSSGADQEVKVWDIRNLKEKSKLSGFGKEVAAALFLGGSEMVLTASGDKSLKVANQPIPGAGQTFLHTAAASSDGKIIITGGEDGVLRVWDGTARKLIREFSPRSAEVASK